MTATVRLASFVVVVVLGVAVTTRVEGQSSYNLLPTAAGSLGAAPQTSTFSYASYLRAVQQRVMERWDGHQRAGSQPGVVFEIGRDGGVNRVALERSSGRADYDAAALQLVRAAAPYPRLPFEYEGRAITIRLAFGKTGNVAVITPGTIISRQTVQIIDAERGNPLCSVEVLLNEPPSSGWQQHWRSVAPRFGLDRAAISRQRLILTFEVAQLPSLPRKVDDALAATNALTQVDEERAQQAMRDDKDGTRRKQHYIDELNQRLR